jgi:thiosulfate/3-mercaptopyruvate sulfurtransferase
MTTPATDLRRAEVFITAHELRQLRAQPAPVVLLEARLPIDVPPAGTGALPEHIPGTVWVDFPTEAAGRGGGTRGRLPLPEIEALQRSARRWGVRAGSQIVVYGDRGPASRIWWLLRWAGFSAVRILDGGLAAWKDAGYPIARETETSLEGDIELRAGHLPVLDADGAARLARSGLLLDARGSTAYRGDSSRSDDVRSGHIPGAASAPTDNNLTSKGTLREPHELRGLFADVGLYGPGGEVGVYCGGGVAACHEIAVLRSIGIDAALFPGSWSAWSADPERKIATGSERG